jgi:CrcB protein
MPWGGILAVGGGAAIGAWLRWGLGIMLNPVFPTLPLGTLAANLIGGLLMGFAMEIITRHAVLSRDASTGYYRFLGGLTIFSTFSAKSSPRCCARSICGHDCIASHVIGSLGYNSRHSAGTRGVCPGDGPMSHPDEREHCTILCLRSRKRIHRSCCSSGCWSRPRCWGSRWIRFRAIVVIRHGVPYGALPQLAADLTVEIEFVVTDDEAGCSLWKERISIFYARVPAEFRHHRGR